MNMCEDFLVDKAKISRIIKRVREINPKIRIATTVLRPYPLGSIKNKNVFFTSTAPDEALPFLKKYLEEKYGCHVKGVSNHLSIRPLLIKELKALKGVDLVLTELKAAAIAVAAKEAKKIGLNTVLMDNIAVIVDKGGDVKNLEKEISGLLGK
jgi:cyclic 2,3-diphosphoglycerate synthetase